MNFTTLITDIAQTLSLDITDATDLSNIKRWINLAYKEVQEAYDWQWRQKWGVFQTILIYETGTVTATLSSRTLTGDSTVWTSAMVGRYIRINGQTDVYRISAVASGTSLTLDMPYTDTTTAGLSYKIFNLFYSLNPDVSTEDDVLLVKSGTVSRELLAIDNKEFSNMISNIEDKRRPRRYCVSGLNRLAYSYSTGTVSGTINTYTLTGSGTLWLDNVKPGDLITISTATYNVDSVESDTSLTLRQKLTAAVTAPAAYTATRDNVLQISIDGSPDPIENIRYLYLCKTYDLVTDTDEFDVPDKYQGLIKYKALAYGYGALDDGRENAMIQLYGASLQKAKLEVINGGNEPSCMVWGV